MNGGLGGPASSTTTLDQTTEAAVEETQLLVLERGGLSVYPLPEKNGLVTIGRGADCTVQLRDPLASRKHASLHVSPLAIEDNASANGTWVGELKVEGGAACPVQLGQVISVGSCLLIVRRGPPVAEPGHSERAAGYGAASEGPVVLEPAMLALHALVARLAKGAINLLVLGETGAGKEVIAEAIHRGSLRAGAPFLRINCSALAEPLLESELFGHERGAFTGATSAKQGLIEAANGGTILLDEVGDLSAALQAKLLRVIEAREVTRVGSVRARVVDVRFISATNRNLQADVERGIFRADLLYRLNGASLEVPPLRERSAEVIPLANEFSRRVARQIGLARHPHLSAEAMAMLLGHDWPGNVRELRNVIERAVLICSGSSIEASHIRLAERPASSHAPPAFDGPLGARAPTLATNVTLAPTEGPEQPPLSAAAEGDPDDGERERIAQALRDCGGNQRRAAKSLGMSLRTLVRRLGRLGLPRPRAFD